MMQTKPQLILMTAKGCEKWSKQSLWNKCLEKENF